MRIITGKLKGRKIRLPGKLDLRPSADRIKESIFGKIEARKELQGSRVLDLFGGSGNLGFEAISRGAKAVTFVEKNPRAARHIRETASQFDIENQVHVINQSVEMHLKGRPQLFDFIFADPPYEIPFIEEMVDTVLENNWLDDDGWFILEHDKQHTFSEHPHCDFSKAYGRTIVSIFKAKPVNQD